MTFIELLHWILGSFWITLKACMLLFFVSFPISGIAPRLKVMFGGKEK